MQTNRLTTKPTHEVIAAIAPHDSVERFEGLGVQVIKETARFIGPREVQAGDQVITGPFSSVRTLGDGDSVKIEAAKRRIRLQVFASDIDAGAVATAREGVYPESIKAEVSPKRLARFFTKEDHGYRVSPDMRAAVVFTEQDLLADPPFSRLDMISCRNLLIYLQPEAQSKVVSVFHFALREGGILLLGGSETVGEGDNRFEIVSKAARIEPVTPPGAAFVTEPFAAILALEAGGRFACRYVGRIPLAKKYGDYPMYRLTRAT